VPTPAPKPTAGAKRVIETYKIIDDTQLKAHIFLPPNFAETDKRPAFVFFHGGGWYEGQPENGYPLCGHFAELGMVAIAFEYRLADQDEITPVECIMDAKSAVRWTRQYASQWGIDPDRIVATGGSAGGHPAVSTAMLEGFEEQGEALSISSSPNALVVWSAPVNPSEDSWFVQLLGDRADLRDCSPAHHVRPGLPPTALLHGTADVSSQ
jgi:acetyl esterase/lipase